MRVRLALFAAGLLLLGSCGGGGGGGSEGNTLPPASTLSVSFGYKQLHFTWTAVSGATSYNLKEDPDGASGFALVAGGSGITATNFDLPLVSLLGRINAKYQLEACNNSGCTPTVLNMASNLSAALGAYVKASNTGASDGFGAAVAISTDGNTLAVGAAGEDSASTGVTAAPVTNTATGDAASNAGAVYVFFRSAGTWSQQAYIKASNSGANDEFGFSLSLSADGNTLAVGAIGESSAATGVNNTSPGQGDNNASLAGAVYVFTRSGTTWTQQAYVKSLNPLAGDLFGFSVALSPDGGTLAVGVPSEDSAATGVNGNTVSDCTAVSPVNCASQSGAVYVYFLDITTGWNPQAYIKASNTGAGDDFGFSVSLSGDGNMLAVGAPIESSALTGVTPGSVNEATALNLAAGAGAAYVFTRASNAWSQHAYVKASNAEAGDRFGQTVALSSDSKTLAVARPARRARSRGFPGPARRRRPTTTALRLRAPSMCLREYSLVRAPGRSRPMSRHRIRERTTSSGCASR